MSKRNLKHVLIIFALIIVLYLCFFRASIFQSNYVQIERHFDAPIYSYKVIKIYPHDASFFTEGLEYHAGVLYESTGLYGRSKLIKTWLETGDKIDEIVLPKFYYGEGLTLLGKYIYQLSYKSHTGFAYDKNTLKLVSTFTYPTEGWGLTNDGTYLIMSDGSATLKFINPYDFKVQKSIHVTSGGIAVNFLNELEYIDGKIFANIWQTDFIAIISPVNGKIMGYIDLTGLNSSPDKIKFPHVLNGIAYKKIAGDKSSYFLLVTGKCWSYLYEIKIFRRH